MTIIKQSYYPGFDILKFICAITIVAAHTNLFAEFPITHSFFQRLISIAIPVFFGISAFVFYSKLIQAEYPKIIFKKNIKRLIILYSTWYILMFPMTYIRFFEIANWKEIIYNILFTSTLNGGWFIKALIINTALLYICRKPVHLIIYTVFGCLIYLLFAYNYIYHFININISPYYSFFYHIAYFCAGAIIALLLNRNKLPQPPKSLLIISWLLLFSLTHFLPIDPIYRLLSGSIFILLFLPVKYEKQPLLSNLRKASVLFYMLQFFLIWIYDSFFLKCFDVESTVYFILNHSILKFSLILLLLSLFTFLVIKLEPKWKHLKYLY